MLMRLGASFVVHIGLPSSHDGLHPPPVSSVEIIVRLWSPTSCRMTDVPPGLYYSSTVVAPSCYALISFYFILFHLESIPLMLYRLNR